MGDHSSPPFAPGNMRTPLAVGWANMFSCGTNASLLRISFPVPASRTYTQPVLPASTTAFVPPTIAITGGLTASRSHTSKRARSEEHTSELQSRLHLVCRLLLEKKKK